MKMMNVRPISYCYYRYPPLTFYLHLFSNPAVLPSASHPSYPYGNPHTITPHAPRSKPPTATHHSLATSLPVLSLPHLHSITTFGEPSERVWTELGLNNLLPEVERREEESEEGGKGKGEAMQPTGQNAGDFPVEEGEEEEGGE